MSRRRTLNRFSQSPNQIVRISEGLKQLGWRGVKTCFEEFGDESNNSHKTKFDFLETLVEHELTSQNTELIKFRQKQAHFDRKNRLADFDFEFQPTINPKQIYDFSSCRFISKKENIIFMGPEGVGKTHLAISLGYEAIEKGYSVLFVKLGMLIDAIKESDEESKRQRLLNSLFRVDLLILDDMDFYPVDEETSTFLFKLVESRHEKGSIIFASQKHYDEWVEVFGSPARTSAILGRINQHGHLVNIDGPSYRLKDKIIQIQTYLPA